MSDYTPIVIILEGFLILLFSGMSLSLWIKSVLQEKTIEMLKDRISCVITDIETDGHTQKGRDNALYMLKGKRND